MIFLALIYLAFISLGLPDSVLGSAWPFMHEALGVRIGMAGYVAAIISGGTIVSSLLAHRVIHRFGTGRVTVVSVGLTAIALIGFSVAPAFWWLLLLAIPLGLGAGAVDSGLNAFVAEHYAARHMNWLHCFWGVGAMLGPVFIAVLAGAGYSWRSGYLSIGLVQVGLVGLLFASLPVWRRFEHSEHGKHGTERPPAAKTGLFAPLRGRGAVFAMIVFLLYTAIEASVMLWGASYLVQTKAIPAPTAAAWVSLFFLGLTVGRALSGFVSFKLDNETLIRIGCVLIIAGFVVMLLPLPAIFTLFAMVLVGLGLAPIFPAMLHQTPIYFGRDNVQGAMGLQMASAYTGTTLMPPLFGLLFSAVSFKLMPGVLLACGIGLTVCTLHLSCAGKRGRKKMAVG